MSNLTAYGPRPISGPRRSKGEMARLRDELVDVVSVNQPMTVRQVSYQMVSRGAIAKTESEYKATIVRLLTDLRRDGELPYAWIADNTRWMRRPRTHSDMRTALEDMQRYYRRALWEEQDWYVEVWLEKDALAGVLYDVTARWDVPLMVTRGYASESFLYTAAEAIREAIDDDKLVQIYYLGDHDPSGVDIPRVVERRLRDMAEVDNAGLDFAFERLAVNVDQIDKFNLPTRPTKGTDTRGRNFKGESVELDAIPPNRLREMVEAMIETHIDEELLARTRLVEKAERQSLLTIIEGLPAQADPGAA